MNESKEYIESLLRNYGQKTNGTNWQCIDPGHEDNNPSASIVGSDGKYRLFCHRCNKYWDRFDILDVVRNKVKGTSFKESKKSTQIETKPKKSTHICSKEPEKEQHIYSLKEIENGGHAKTLDELKRMGEVTRYFNADKTAILMVTVRVEKDGGKDIYQYIPNGSGFIGGTPKPLPLLNLPSLAKADTVVVVEGEKCVKALHQKGIIATTKPAGGNSPEKADWSPLYGKEVILWPDWDNIKFTPDGKPNSGCMKGVKYMDKVRDILLPHCKVKMVHPEEYNLPDKGGDCVDWIAMCGEDNNAIPVPIDDATACGASRHVKDRLGAMASGDWAAVDFPSWPTLSRLTQAIIPQTVTILFGEAGDGKSLFKTQACSEWLDAGIPFASYELEEDRTYHLVRAVAQRAKVGQYMTIKSWLGQYDKVEQVCSEHADWMDRLGSRIWELPLVEHKNSKGNIIKSRQPLNRCQMTEWVTQRAIEGSRIILIDPITMLEALPGETVWEADKKFMSELKSIAVTYELSIFLITHPSSGNSRRIELDSMSGGRAFRQFCQCAIIIQLIKEEQHEFHTACGTLEYPINRIVHLVKTRNADGKGYKIGFYWDKETATFIERGILDKDK